MTTGALSAAMRFTDEERDILAGKQGAARQEALRHQIKVGEFFGAADFVPVTPGQPTPASPRLWASAMNHSLE